MSTTATRGESKHQLRQIFDAMAYGEKQTDAWEAAQKWLEESSKGLFSSCVNKALYGNEKEGKTVSLKDLPQAKARLINNENSVLQAYKQVFGKDAKIASLTEEDRSARLTKFRDLLKSKAATLVQLEAYATSIAALAIKKQDESKWQSSIDSATSTQIRKQLEGDNLLVSLKLHQNSYCLKDIIAVLSAVVQVDAPTLFFVSPTDESSVGQILPILFLIDAVNNASIQKQAINFLLLAPELSSSDSQLLSKLAAIDETLKRDKSGIIEIGHLSSARRIHSIAVKELSSEGKSLHFVIDNSANIVSTIGAVSQHTWFSGVSMNHRCRTLAFVHQPVYGQVVDELKSRVEAIKVAPWAKPDGDFLSRNVKTISRALSSIGTLGAKVISNSSDFSMPSVVYDIGTSSDLVALKEAGLGHVLVLIPYRSLNELASLGNNFGVADQLFVYSNSEKDIIGKLNASVVFINSASSNSSPALDLSWQVISKSTVKSTAPTTQALSASKVAVNSSKWKELSYCSKVETLEKLVGPQKTLKLLSLYMGVRLNESAFCLSRKVDNSLAAGVIMNDAAGISDSQLLASLSACFLRDKPVLVISVGSELCSKTAGLVKDSTPPGLVSFVSVNSLQDIAPLTAGLDLLWILQGSNAKFSPEELSISSENRILLVNSASDEMELLYNSKIAIESAYKVCYL